MNEFPPAYWNYGKIIAGGPGSKFDFEYIAEFSLEAWKRRLGERLNNNFCIEKSCFALCEKHVSYMKNGYIDDYKKDLDDLVKELDNFFMANDEDCGWFLKLSYRSAKDVPQGRFPVWKTEDVITAIVCSERCFDDMVAHQFHQRNHAYLPPMLLHLLPYEECNRDRELRCFVYDRRLCAITNQFPEDPWLFEGHEIELILTIRNFVCRLWQKHSDLYDEAVIDVEVSEDMQPNLIEFNPYFKKGSTAAVLFDWEQDKSALENRGGRIEFRVRHNHSVMYQDFVESFQLPKDVIESKIIPLLTLKDIGRFRRTCKQIARLGRKAMDQKRDDKLFAELCEGEWLSSGWKVFSYDCSGDSTLEFEECESLWSAVFYNFLTTRDVKLHKNYDPYSELLEVLDSKKKQQCLLCQVVKDVAQGICWKCWIQCKPFQFINLLKGKESIRTSHFSMQFGGGALTRHAIEVKTFEEQKNVTVKRSFHICHRTDMMCSQGGEDVVITAFLF